MGLLDVIESQILKEKESRVGKVKENRRYINNRKKFEKDFAAIGTSSVEESYVKSKVCS